MKEKDKKTKNKKAKIEQEKKNKKQIHKDEHYAEKRVKAKVNRKKIIITIILIIATIYILYAVMLLNQDEKDTIFVEQGTIRQEETVLGYIIRNEKVIKNEEYQNGIIQIATEGEKVYKNEAIFQYYSDEAKDLSNEMTDLDLQIQEKLKTEKITSNADIKLIETQIEEKIDNLRKLNNTQEITEYKKAINTLLEKKISTLLEINGATDELKQLIKKRNNINEKIRNSTTYLSSPISGIASYRIDGLEEELTPESFSNITSEYLKNLNLKAGQIIATSSKAGKVIDNFTYYIATTMNSKEAMESKIGDKVKIRLSTNDEINAKIAHINEEEKQRVIILKIDRLTEKLINYRKISFDVIWSSDSGFKVSNKAIGKDEKGLFYVIRTRSGYLTKLLIKVINENENYSIVSAYSTEELTNLGFSQEEISDYKKIKLYDEILLYPTLEKIK